MRALHGVDPRRVHPDHLGLAYDVWAPVTHGEGKVPDDLKSDWLGRLERWTPPVDYAIAFARWVESFADDGSRTVACKLTSRLLLGHGNPAPSEVGISVHHTWGVPILSGSALKGLLAHYVEAVYGPDESDIHPMASDHPDPPRANWQGVTWNGPRIVHGPGRDYRILFGAPDAESDTDHGEAGATRGEVVFHDALYIPPSFGEPTVEYPYAQDVLTVHQRTYYDSAGEGGFPNDYEDPNPVSFLTVRPGAGFLIALSGDLQWTKLALSLLRDALHTWGIGGKTSSGYGRIDFDHWHPLNDPDQKAVEGSDLIARFTAWIMDDTPKPGSKEPPVARERMETLKSDWLDELRDASPAEREAAAKLLEKRLKAKRVREEMKAIVAELRGES